MKSVVHVYAEASLHVSLYGAVIVALLSMI